MVPLRRKPRPNRPSRRPKPCPPDKTAPAGEVVSLDSFRKK